MFDFPSAGSLGTLSENDASDTGSINAKRKGLHVVIRVDSFVGTVLKFRNDRCFRL